MKRGIECDKEMYFCCFSFDWQKQELFKNANYHHESFYLFANWTWYWILLNKNQRVSSTSKLCFAWPAYLSNDWHVKKSIQILCSNCHYRINPNLNLILTVCLPNDSPVYCISEYSLANAATNGYLRLYNCGQCETNLIP